MRNLLRNLNVTLLDCLVEQLKLLSFLYSYYIFSLPLWWIKINICIKMQHIIVLQLRVLVYWKVKFLSIIPVFVLHVRLRVDWVSFVWSYNCMYMVLSSVCLCLSVCFYILSVFYCLMANKRVHYALTVQSVTSNFARYMLDEVGTLCTVLLNVYSRTCMLIFIKIGLYSTNTEQIICCHGFWDTMYIHSTLFTTYR